MFLNLFEGVEGLRLGFSKPSTHSKTIKNTKIPSKLIEVSIMTKFYDGYATFICTLLSFRTTAVLCGWRNCSEMHYPLTHTVHVYLKPNQCTTLGYIDYCRYDAHHSHRND